MIKIKSIYTFCVNYVFPYLGRYILMIGMSVLSVYLLFFEKPQSIIRVLIAIIIFVFLKVISHKIKRINSFFIKIYNYFTPKPKPKERFTYLESLLMACFVCDLIFNKNCAILGCIVGVAIFIGLDIIDQFGIIETNITKGIAIFVMIIASFIFAYFKYNYFLSHMSVLFIAILLSVVQLFSYKIKQVGQPIIISVATAILINFFVISVIG